MKTDIDPFAYIDAMIFLIRHRIPYNEWPDELKIAGLTLDFYGDEDEHKKSDRTDPKANRH